ncbi:MAG TPA: serine/threonine-protein kinase [Candidatus Thermoplasmatota archaeon]|nr:serine/threonine-protein kinase [Candidatus Thermoplasmatota archaeon]
MRQERAFRGAILAALLAAAGAQAGTATDPEVADASGDEFYVPVGGSGSAASEVDLLRAYFSVDGATILVTLETRSAASGFLERCPNCAWVVGWTVGGRQLGAMYLRSPINLAYEERAALVERSAGGDGALPWSEVSPIGFSFERGTPARVVFEVPRAVLPGLSGAGRLSDTFAESFGSTRAHAAARPTWYLADRAPNDGFGREVPVPAPPASPPGQTPPPSNLSGNDTSDDAAPPPSGSARVVYEASYSWALAPREPDHFDSLPGDGPLVVETEAQGSGSAQVRVFAPSGSLAYSRTLGRGAEPDSYTMPAEAGRWRVEYVLADFASVRVKITATGGQGAGGLGTQDLSGGLPWLPVALALGLALVAVALLLRGRRGVPSPAGESSRGGGGPRPPRYRTLRELPSGAFGRVVVSEDTQLGRKVVVKQLHPQWRAIPKMRAAFLREARVAGSVNHPNVVIVHDVDEENDAIIMEFVEGGSLAERVQKGPLGAPEALRVADEILAGLERVHEEGIFHRDLKPANILFARDGRAKVADFGIAHSPNVNVTTLSSTGHQPGTPLYMAPEQLRNEPADARTDLYAVAALLHLMATGKHYLGQPPRDYYELRTAVLEGEPTLDPSLAPGIAAVVRKGLAKRREDRFPSAADMRAAVRDALLRLRGAHGGE